MSLMGNELGRWQIRSARVLTEMTLTRSQEKISVGMDFAAWGIGNESLMNGLEVVFYPASA